MGTPVPKPKPKERKRNSFKKNYAIPREACPLEESDQMAVCDWMDWNGICYQGSQVGAFLAPATFNRMKRMGVKAGHPDIIIYDSPPMLPNKKGTAIEMKRVKGGVVSDLQKEWQTKLTERGWIAMVCRGADEAISFLKTLGYGKPQNPKH